jgi:hypothetical protein
MLSIQYSGYSYADYPLSGSTLAHWYSGSSLKRQAEEPDIVDDTKRQKFKQRMEVSGSLRVGYSVMIGADDHKVQRSQVHILLFLFHFPPQNDSNFFSRIFFMYLSSRTSRCCNFVQ